MGRAGIEPAILAEADFKSAAYACFATGPNQTFLFYILANTIPKRRLPYGEGKLPSEFAPRINARRSPFVESHVSRAVKREREAGDTTGRVEGEVHGHLGQAQRGDEVTAALWQQGRVRPHAAVKR